jgi:hypothetical protein
MTKEEQNKYHRKYYQDHKKHINEQRKPLRAKQYKLRRDYFLKKAKKYRLRHKKEVKKSNERWRWQFKLDVLSHYGPQGKLQCSWPDCEVIDIDMLTLDHINNDGCKDRKNKKASTQTYFYCKNAGYPLGYQTLCSNHNLKKEILRKRELRGDE